MCLVTFQNEPQRATKDIECYKIVSFGKKDGEYHSYYYFQHKWVLNELYSSPLNKKGTRVEEGFHSYAYLNNAKQTMELRPLGSVLVKCIIPKGTCYYEGKQGDYDGYASDNIKIVEVIDSKGELVNDNTYPYKVGDEIEIQQGQYFHDTYTIDSIYKYNDQYHIFTPGIGIHIITDEKGQSLGNVKYTIRKIKED